MTDTPREVFLKLVHGVCEERWEDVLDLYAERTDVSHPFHPLKEPAMLSRDELRAHFGGGARPYRGPTLRRRPAAIRVHETADPEVVVGEFRYEGTVVETGEPFTMPGVFVMRVRDGKIVESRDYLDHLSSAAARGRLAEVLDAIRDHHAKDPAAVADGGPAAAAAPGPVSMPTMEPGTFHAPFREQFETFLDEHRARLHGCLDGLTEEQARRSLVPSKTTLLGLVKHGTFIEKVWFDEGITGRPRTEIGIPDTPDESFDLDGGDTVASVQEEYRRACEASRRATADLSLDDELRGNRRGPLPLRFVYLHMLRELAQHCGHADILREQVLTG
ncbi:DUF664 domain-containing protein [Spirillospora sp. NPDC029432]|uniref:mycothiol transferase n=1 Tax=Spirillospora sp. NPDC029432 TaxID=3154599 RepID=UPI003456E672